MVYLKRGSSVDSSQFLQIFPTSSQTVNASFSTYSVTFLSNITKPLLRLDSVNKGIGIGTASIAHALEIENGGFRAWASYSVPAFIEFTTSANVDIKARNNLFLRATNGFASSDLDFLKFLGGSHDAQALGTWQWRAGTKFDTGSVGIRLNANASWGGLVLLINENNTNWDYQFKTLNDNYGIWLDGELNAVGLGTGTPAAKLHVVGIQNKPQLRVDSYASQTTIAVSFRNSNASPAYWMSGAGNQTNFFNETTFGNSNLLGTQVRKVRMVTHSDSPFTPSTDHILLCNASTASISITLPAASSSSGVIYNIKKIDSTLNAITVSAPELIDGVSTQAITDLSSMQIVNNGLSWYII